MPNLIPSNQGLDTTGSSRLLNVPDRRTARELAVVERQTVTRMARVRGDVMVQVEKTHEIDRLAREAMSGQAMLTRWGQTLAQGDPFINDDLKFFTDLAKMAKGEIIADTASSFCQEGSLMLFLGIFLLLAVVAVICLTFLLGFRLGGHSSWAEAQRVRSQAAAAERELHNLARSAFVAMADEADRQRRR